MLLSTENFYKTFELVRKRIPFKVYVKSVNSEEIILRSDIKDLNEASLFVEAYESVTNSKFKEVPHKTTGINSPVCRKKWICHAKEEGKDEKCSAKINLLIKKINKVNVMNDAFLRRKPPFPSVIKIDPNHNHFIVPVNCTPLKFVKINDGVKECFYAYFKRGISGAKAKHLHEYNLLKANFHSLDDTSMNPTLSSIFSLYRNWLKLKENVHVYKDHGIPTQIASIQNSSPCLKEPVFGNSTAVQDLDTTNSMTFASSDSNIVGMNSIITKFENDSDSEFSANEQTTFEVKKELPVLHIKQEVIDDDENDGLPVISSYGSLAPPKPPSPPPLPPPPPVQNVATVVKVQPSSTQVVMYDKSSNTYKVVKCVAVCPKYSSSVYSASQYSSHMPGSLLPSRISVQKL